MKNYKKYLLALVLMLTPMFASAQFRDIDTFFKKIISFINDILIPLLFTVALLVFLYGIFEYFIRGGGDPEKRKEGRQLAIYAIVGFVIMVSIWGIVNVIAGGLGWQDQEIKEIPNAIRNNT